jgi:hypothetical protein
MPVAAPLAGSPLAVDSADIVLVEWRAEPARYVLAMTPRIKSLIDSLHDGSGRSPEEVFEAHDSELLGWP